MSKEISEKEKQKLIDEFKKRVFKIAELLHKDHTFEELPKIFEKEARRIADELGLGVEIGRSRKNEYGYEGERVKRISIYIYPAQLKMIEEISKKRDKSKRSIFLEAIQTYIGMFLQGKV